MATNILNYAPEATPPSMVGPSTTQSPVSHAPHATPPSAPTASGDQDLWAGRLRPAEIQIIVIVIVAGLFNAFFLVVSLRFLWRRYHAPVQPGDSSAASPAPPGSHTNLRRVTPMLVRQPDDELVYGLKQVLDEDDRPKPPVL